MRQGIRHGLVVSVRDLETKSRRCGHDGVLLGKAYFLAKYWFVHPGIMNKWTVTVI